MKISVTDNKSGETFGNASMSVMDGKRVWVSESRILGDTQSADLKPVFDCTDERLKVGELIHQRRKELNLSYDKLMIELGTNKQTLFNIEKGRASVGLDFLVRLCYVLRMKIEIPLPE